MKIAICDDEKIFLDKTHDLIEEWASENNLHIDVFKFTNGDDLLHAHGTECMDLIILDIIMPLFNGIETAKELRNIDREVPIIFLTSSKDYAVDSYDVKAYYYLLKPIDNSKFFNILNGYLASTEKHHEIFLAKTHSGYRKINLQDICYIEAQNKVVDIILNNGTTVEVYELFSKCEEIFSGKKYFFKCHRSYIVNLSYVSQFTKTEIFTGTGTSIPISRNRYTEFKEAYFEHMFNNE